MCTVVALVLALLVLFRTLVSTSAAQDEKKSGRLILVTSMSVKVTSHTLVRHVLKEQKRLGVLESNVIVLLNGEDIRSDEYIAAERLLYDAGVAKIVPWVFQYDTLARVFLERYVQAELKMTKHDWIVWADMDEVPDLGGKTYLDLASECERHGYTHVVGFLRDRLTSNGTLIEVREDVPLSEQFPLTCAVTTKLVKGNNNKVCI